MEKKSQSEQLKKIICQSLIAVITGSVLLLLSVGMNLWMNRVADEALETTMYLNQYRLGSKNLTSAVQTFAVTADSVYYDAYMKEINEDKNRDIAWEGLRKNNIKDEEWAVLNQIADLSNGLVPLEEEAFSQASAGNTEAASACVFGEEYESAARTISSLTDDVIGQIQGRVSRSKKNLRIFQVLAELLYISSFLYLIFQILKIVKFSRKELLEPIVSVSGQMGLLADGNFHEDLKLAVDESEVGKMAGSILRMKQNITSSFPAPPSIWRKEARSRREKFPTL